MNNLVKQLNNFHCKDKIVLSRRGIIEFYKEIREILFYDFYHQEFNENEANKLLEDAKSKYLNFAKISKNEDLFDKLNEFINELPHIKDLLIDDVKALYEGDPSVNSYCEVVLTYPGFVAISAYRIAHKLYTQDLKFPARVISEYAHSRTGVDINPGATIGRSFFIDHGTGIVIGETTIIGNNVKLYQGVTLGALSLKDGRSLKNKKRHPTIEDNVTIYSGASIFGGETTIGKNSVIGSNVFIVKSIEPNSKVRLNKVDIEIIKNN